MPTCDKVETEDGCLCKPTSKDGRGLPYSGCSADGDCEAVETCDVVTATQTHKCNAAQHLPMILQQGWNYTLELSVQENYIRFTCPEVPFLLFPFLEIELMQLAYCGLIYVAFR